LTRPVSSTDTPGERDVADLKFGGGNDAAVAVLQSTLSTSVRCGPLWTGANANFECFPWLHGVDAAPRKHAPMKERVTGPIGECKEAKPLLGAEAFDYPMD
jgi:hypothetical protein